MTKENMKILNSKEAVTVMASLEFFMENGNYNGCDDEWNGKNLSGITEEGNDRSHD